MRRVIKSSYIGFWLRKCRTGVLGLCSRTTTSRNEQAFVFLMEVLVEVGDEQGWKPKNIITQLERFQNNFDELIHDLK